MASNAWRIVKIVGVGATVIGGAAGLRRLGLNSSGRSGRKAEEPNHSDQRRGNGPSGSPRPHGQRDERALDGIYDPGTRVHAYILGFLHPNLDEEDLARRCVDLAPKAQREAYEYVQRMVDVERLSLDRVEMIRRTLQAVVAPDVDWQHGIEAYPIDGAEERVWNGVGTIVDIVEANLDEKELEDRGRHSA
jgi:hypothetical protein